MGYQSRLTEILKAYQQSSGKKKRHLAMGEGGKTNSSKFSPSSAVSKKQEDYGKENIHPNTKDQTTRSIYLDDSMADQNSSIEY